MSKHNVLLLGHMGHNYFVVEPQVVPHVSRYISILYNLGAQEAQLFMLVKYSKKRVYNRYVIILYYGKRRAPRAPNRRKSLFYMGLSLGHN